eukprot:NODE_1187_length_1614_cov_15.763282_g1118_i0.p1 GENE.NODE_1187_length_1614_cov_15.763282_g1118_i0~~NODE_1187_length_1614_cov_15.763282_g1118_i0.p1  ORF type:complete len:400 (+),score=80.95 NODE_1187_length_1614_cov_15.763282_g1118_i0:34-1233(+)
MDTQSVVDGLQTMFPDLLKVQIREALQRCKGDVDDATNLLLTYQVQPNSSPPHPTTEAALARQVTANPSSQATVASLQSMFPGVRPIQIREALQRSQGNVEAATSLLLSQAGQPPPTEQESVVRALFCEPTTVHRELVQQLGHTSITSVLEALANTDGNLAAALELLRIQGVPPALTGEGKLHHLFSHLPKEAIEEALRNTDGDEELAIQLLKSQERVQAEQDIATKLEADLERDYWSALETMKQSRNTTQVEIQLRARKHNTQAKEIVTQGQGEAWAHTHTPHPPCPNCGHRAGEAPAFQPETGARPGLCWTALGSRTCPLCCPTCDSRLRSCVRRCCGWMMRCCQSLRPPSPDSCHLPNDVRGGRDQLLQHLRCVHLSVPRPSPATAVQCDICAGRL